MAAMPRKQEAQPEIPPGADSGVPPDVFARLMANPPTGEQQAQWLADLKQSRRDGLYLNSIKDHILAEHGDCWIAAYGEEVVAIADTWQKLHNLLEAAGVPRDKPARRHFQKHPPHMIPGLRRWL